MEVTVKRSDIEFHRNYWKNLAQRTNWYKEPFYIQIFVNQNGTVNDSVSVRDIMTKDVLIPLGEDNTIVIDENN